MSGPIGKFHEREALLRRAVVTKGRDVDRAQVVEELRAILVEQLGVDASEGTEASALQEDLKAVLLGLVELIMEMEDRFKLKIPDEDAEKISTVGEAVDYVVAH